MPGEPPKEPPRRPATANAPEEPRPRAEDDAPGNAQTETGSHEDRGIGDFVRRAVSAGFEVASRSKDDVLRIASAEIRSWLDRLDLDRELSKALSKMTIEVNAQIRFRPREDGTLEPQTTTNVRIHPPEKDPDPESK